MAEESIESPAEEALHRQLHWDPEAQATLDSGAKCKAIPRWFEMAPRVTCFYAPTHIAIETIERNLPTALMVSCCV